MKPTDIFAFVETACVSVYTYYKLLTFTEKFKKKRKKEENGRIA